MRFVDTNIFLRHILNDHPTQSPKCFALIQAIEQGRETAWTSDMVFAEIVFVLSNKHTYDVPRERLRDVLLPIINLPGLKLPGKRMYQRIFELYTSLPIDYVDAFHIALAENQDVHEIYSYDAHFDKVEGITRLEPDRRS